VTGLYHRHPYPGRLIVVEGIDGSGKSTQLHLIHRWLEAEGYRVFFTEWNSSDLVRRAIRRGQKERPADANYFQPAACRRFRRPPYLSDYAAA
jgi:thymidylate kinase